MKFRTLVITLAMAGSMPAAAAVLTVGPDGTYSNLQAALDVARNNGQDDEIRIQAGTLQTTAQVSYSEDFFLEIIGGWNSAFTSGVSDPAATVLSGGQAQQVLSMAVSDGNVLIRNLTLADGSSANGAGADFTVSNQARLELTQCEVLRNAAFGGTSASGGGVRVTLSSDATAEVSFCLFAQNQVQATTASGGGLMVVAPNGSFSGNTLEFINNAVVGSGSARGGAIAVDAGDQDPSVNFFRVRARSNRIESNTASLGAGIHVLTSPSLSGPFITFEGVEARGNRRDGSAAGAAQVEVQASAGNLTFRSVAAVDGVNASGVRIDATVDAQVFGVNITAAGNDVDGIRHEDGSSDTQAQFNAVAFGNGAAQFVLGNDGNGGVQSAGNLLTDPGVIDAVNGDYRLATGSSAIDNCFNNPLGGIGTTDADFGARAIGPTVDCGAYEWSADNEDALFNDSFESI